ncbi:MAG: hypothetical protein LAQ30_21105 [Acidobacteriia bacterium]|nr:hypothetical protein [Terriglobia bacterium]
MAAPLWTDLTTLMAGGDAVYYKTVGTAGSRQFVAQWNNVYVVGSIAPVVFQAVLYEGTNKILFQYQTIGSGGASATVGVRDVSGQTSGCRMQWSYKADVLKDGSAVLFTPADTLDPVAVTIGTTPAGGFTVDGVSFGETQTPNWTPCSRHTIAVPDASGSGGTRYAFSSWNDSGAQSHTVYGPASPGTAYTAMLTPQYLLTPGSSPSAGGTVGATPAAADGYYNSGAAVQVTATANTGYQFANYSGGGSTATQSIAMDAPKTVTANFTALTPVTIQTVPAGVSYTVGDTTYSDAHTFLQAPGTTISVTAVSPQTLASVRYGFKSWSDGPATLNRTITVGDSAAAYTATFVEQYPVKLTISPTEGGSVAVTPTSSDGYYNVGTLVTMTATPTGGWAFDSFSGDAAGGSPAIMTIDRLRAVTATFLQKVNFTINTSPAGRALTVDGAACPSPCSNGWVPGSTHAISVQDSESGGAGARYVFSGWSDGGAASHTITAAASGTTYTASFETQYQLTMTPGSGGTLTANPTSADGYYPAGTSVEITAAAGSSAQFNAFGGALSGNTNPQPVTMSAARVVTASFTTLLSVTIASSPAGRVITVDGEPIVTPRTFSWAPNSSHTVAAASPQNNTASAAYLFASWSDGGAASHTITPATAGTYTAAFQTGYLLSLTASPAGSGTVTASPAAPGNFYASGATVQISAVPANGMAFSSFSGDVNAAANPQTLTMNAAKSVTANFGAAQNGPTAVTGQVSVTSSGLTYNRANLTYNGTVTVKNNGAGAITGPVELVFTSLTTGVTLVNATGLYGGSPYLTLPGIATLAPGQSASVAVQFRNTSTNGIKYTPAVYSGSLN